VENVIFFFEEYIQMDNCSICLEKLEDKDLYQSNKCKHLFHLKCINIWFNNHITCPLCRTKIRLPKITIQFPNRQILSEIDMNFLVEKLIKYEKKNKLLEKKIHIQNKNNKFYIYSSKSQKLLGYFH